MSLPTVYGQSIGVKHGLGRPVFNYRHPITGFNKTIVFHEDPEQITVSAIDEVGKQHVIWKPETATTGNPFATARGFQLVASPPAFRFTFSYYYSSITLNETSEEGEGEYEFLQLIRAYRHKFQQRHLPSGYTLDLYPFGNTSGYPYYPVFPQEITIREVLDNEARIPISDAFFSGYSAVMRFVSYETYDDIPRSFLEHLTT